MRTTSVFINRLNENGFPFAGKIKFTLMSTEPDFISHKQPISAFFINGKAKVQLIPNIFISKNVSTYYHYEIFAQHPVNAPTEVEFELIEEGDCIVPIKPSCLQEILIPTQTGYAPYSGSSCNCQDYQGATSSSNGIHGLVPAATTEEADYFLKGDETWGTIANNTDYLNTVENLSSEEIDISQATAFIKVIEADTIFTFSGTPAGQLAFFFLKLQGGGDYTVIWPNNVHWNNDTEPELTSEGTDILVFMTFDSGTNWYGSLHMSGIYE